MNIVVLLVLVIELCSFLAQNGLIRNLRREQVGLTGSFKTEILTTTFSQWLSVCFSKSGSSVPMILMPRQSDKECIPSNQVICRQSEKRHCGCFKNIPEIQSRPPFDHSSHSSLESKPVTSHTCSSLSFPPLGLLGLSWPSSMPPWTLSTTPTATTTTGTTTTMTTTTTTTTSTLQIWTRSKWICSLSWQVLNKQKIKIQKSLGRGLRSRRSVCKQRNGAVGSVARFSFLNSFLMDGKFSLKIFQNQGWRSLPWALVQGALNLSSLRSLPCLPGKTESREDFLWRAISQTAREVSAYSDGHHIVERLNRLLVISHKIFNNRYL